MDMLGDFFKQEFVIKLLLLMIGSGLLYAALSIYIIRRHRRRRLAKEASNGQLRPEPVERGARKLPLGNFLRGELPNKPLPPADWTVPAELRNIPEPDLDMLAMPVSVPSGTTEPQESLSDVAAPSTTTSQTNSATPTLEPDWITAVVPAQENAMSPATTDSQPNKPEKSTEDVVLNDAVEVMRIWRDLSDGKLIIQIGNQRYRSLSDIPGPDLSRRFVAVVRELWAMVNNAPTRSTGTQLAAGTPANGIADPAADPVAGGLKARLGLLSSEPEPQKPPHLVKQMARQAMGQSTTPQNEQPAGIANAVEDFLQFKLSTTPALARRSIHIRTAHDHGIRIEVDGHYYDAIGDVVDPDVREFLFAMMREWEARH